MTKHQIIAVARQGRDGKPHIPAVLQVAARTTDRHLLAVCLDCFRAVLQDEQSPVAFEVIQFIGDLLRDDAYRRIRKRLLITAIWIGRACWVILPELVAAYRKPTTLCVLAPARWAVIDVAWEALAHGDATERKAAINAFDQIHSLGLLNLRSFLGAKCCNATNRAEVEQAIARLEARGCKA